MNAVVQQPQQSVAVSQKIDPLSNLKRAMYPQIKALAGNNEKKANALFATAVRIASDPKIMACTQPSIISFFTRAIDLGLNLDPAFGEVYPIPYGKELQFQLGAKGYAALAQRLGGWELQVIPIFDCDTYKVTKKMENGFMVNDKVIIEFDDATREANMHNQDWCFEHLRCVMANARRLENGKYVTYSLEPAMTKGEINRRRFLSSNQKSEITPSGIWHDHFLAMAEKTALGALAKKLPKDGMDKFLKVIEDNEKEAIESTATVVEMPQKPLSTPAQSLEPDNVEDAVFSETPEPTVDTNTGEILEPVILQYTTTKELKGMIDACESNNQLVALWETVPDDVKPKFQEQFDIKQDLLRFG